MVEYKTKKELINEINKAYDLFVIEFSDIQNKDLHIRIESVDKTPSEMISYQIGWLNLILKWEKDEMSGKEVITPSPNIKWNQLGKLYQSFYEFYKNDDLQTLLKNFDNVKNEFVNWINTLEEEILFSSNQRQWAYTKANWPVWKWLHINSVAPFKNFRSKIRKWKKENNIL